MVYCEHMYLQYILREGHLIWPSYMKMPLVVEIADVETTADWLKGGILNTFI